MKKILALVLVVGLVFCLCSVALADESPGINGDTLLSRAAEIMETPVVFVSPAFAVEEADEAPPPVAVEKKTDSEKKGYFGLVTTIILMLAIILAIRGLKAKGKRASPGNIFSEEGLEAGKDQLEHIAEKISGELWKARKEAQGALDDIDKEYYENLDRVKSALGLNSEKKEE
jgi:hypothetical protein